MNTLHTPKASSAARGVFWLVLLFLLATRVMAQQSATDGATPLALAPGTPAGSYPLSGFDNVNLYNGGLNFQLPLLGIAGRGSAGYKMTLPIEQKWRVSSVMDPQWIAYYDGGGPPLPPPTTPEFQDFPVPNWWTGIKPGYGPGVMHGRMAQFGEQDCPDSTTRAYWTLTRLTFTAPDGTEFELRDQLTGGAPATVGICDASGQSRGTVFVTADGSAATFISDTTISDYIFTPAGGDDLFYPSGYLLMRDGTRYRIDNGVVSWLRDRNGNKITFTYDGNQRVTSIKDSLNRVVNVSYGGSSDQITYKGFSGLTRTITVNYASLSGPSVLRTGFFIQTYKQLFQELNAASQYSSFNPTVVSSVTLPNNRQYQFQYNSYGELARVTLPTGGATEYDYAEGMAGDNASGVTAAGYEGASVVYRRVVERRIYPDGGSGSNYASRMTYSRPEALGSQNLGYVVTDELNSGGSLLARSKHYFYGSAAGSFATSPVGYSIWNDGREYQTDVFDTNGTTVLRRTGNTFAQRAPVSWWTGSAETAPPNDPRVTETINTIEPASANLVSKQTFGYDDTVPYNNQNNVKEYDFGSGTPGALVREARTTFVTATSYTDASTGAHLRSLATQVSVYNASGVERARSTFEFDNYTPDGGNHAGLTNRSGISGLDAAFTTSYTTRGNATATTNYLLNTSGAVIGSISAYAQYDIAGNVVKTIDGRGYATLLYFDDCFGAPDGNAILNSAPLELSSVSQTSYAFATTVTNAAGHTVKGQFDYYLGRPVDGQDANGIVASGYYADALDRPTQVRRAVGTGTENQTTFSYDDTNRIVTTTSDLNSNNDNLLIGKVLYDNLGRTIESKQYEGGTNYIAAQTQYDALGRAFRISNPFRPWQSETAAWTTSAFDALSRVTSVTTPDSAAVTSSYSGNTVTVTDQAGKVRRSMTDALGRLIRVDEPDANNNLGSVSSPVQPTSYTYDTLDNLTAVNQGNQTRTFAYDSLRRLTSATNPESGAVSYQYDNNGNLLTKTDARNITTNFVYDALNRLTSRSYSDGTPNVTYSYDSTTIANGKGRLGSVSSSVSSYSYSGYDALGRPLGATQTIGSQSYSITNVVYDLAGHLKTMTYPSGRTITNTFDNAGRLSSFAGNLGDGTTTRTYANDFSYSSFGGLQQEKFGTDTAIYHKQRFNARGQLWDMRASTVSFGADPANGDRGSIVNYYSNNFTQGGSGPENNGNLLRQESYIPGSSFFQDTFAYDSLNRLTSISEKLNGTGSDSFKQAYIYDRWGNRTIDQVNTTANVPKPNFGVNTTNNRLTAPAGYSMSYDAAGNLTTDTYTGEGNRTYDAENRMKQAWANNQWQTYSYDGDGRRIKRIVNGTETWQVYGLGGELLAEYAPAAAPAAPRKEYGYRNGELLITAEGRTNVALAANGGVASASSSHTCCGFSLGGAINGNINGPWGNGEGWNDATENALPDWYQVDFAGSKTINEIDVFSLHDDYTQPNTPTETQTFSLYGLVNFEVQYWNGSAWATIPSGSVTGNNKVWRKFTFAPITTSKIRLWISSVPDAWSRLVELQAYEAAGGGGSQNVTWINASGVAVNGNGLTKTAATGWGNAGAVSSQTITSGDGYVEFTPTDTATNRFCGLSNGDSNQNYTDVDFALHPSGGTIYIYESGASRGTFGSFAAGDVMRVGVEGGVVKYRKNGTLLYTSTVMPTYPLLVDSALYANGDTLSNVVIGGVSSSAQIRWLVADQLGTPRMVFDQTGSLANVSRHDYLPFGEELFGGPPSQPGAGGRTTTMGYTASDNVRQKFTQKERDNETGLDYFIERYYASAQGRFISVDPLGSSAIIADPQSFNRYVYVLNNPLRYIDPYGMSAQDPWKDLTREEQILLASKFTKVKNPGNPTSNELSAAGKTFNERVQVTNIQTGELNVEQTTINFKSVRNFVDQLGDDPRVWSQIKSIEGFEADSGGGSSGIYFTVNNDADFVSAMRRATGSSGSEMFIDLTRLEGHLSIRQVGSDYTDASLHVGKHASRFGAHWDPTSSVTYSTLANGPALPVMEGAGSLIAGMAHWFTGHASADRVREQLKRERQVPRSQRRSR
jgi:RHS repeat-associated protein